MALHSEKMDRNDGQTQILNVLIMINTKLNWFFCTIKMSGTLKVLSLANLFDECF